MTEFPKYIFIDDSTIKKRKPTNILRSEMENGPVKTRPLQSGGLFNIVFDVAIPVTREGEFDQWFNKSLGYGAYWFLLNDPLDGQKKRFRFLDTEIEWKKGGNLLRSTFTLEAYDDL